MNRRSVSRRAWIRKQPAHVKKQLDISYGKGVAHGVWLAQAKRSPKITVTYGKKKRKKR
jgi:hypothetical protein